MTTNPSAGDTVIPTKTRKTRPGEIFPGKIESLLARTESTPAARKRYLESSSQKIEVPRKSPRRGELPSAGRDQEVQENEVRMCVVSEKKTTSGDELETGAIPIRRNIPPRIDKRDSQRTISSSVPRILKRPSEDVLDGTKPPRKSRFGSVLVKEPEDETAKEIPPPQCDPNVLLQRTQVVHQQFPKRDEAVKLRKTIQWLEEGARRMREDLAAARAELHEERRAARLARRELDSAVKEARTGEAARHLHIISELKARLAQSPTRPMTESTSTSSKAELLKEENHRRELSALRKRLAEAEATVQRLKTTACSPHGSGKRRKIESTHGRRLEVEVEALRTTNRKLEERLQVVVEAERKRTAELRTQHENHEAQLAALQKTLRSDTIKMMDEIRSKTREIEKLEKLVLEGSQMHRKLQTKEDDLMRKLRETERSHQIRLPPPRLEEKISGGVEHVEDSCNGDCDAAAEVERLRELTVEQQEVIEVLRQAVKEKERKLEQISNKKRKEEFYKQWLELEPVVEVEDEEDHEHEEGDSALSSAPSSLSPQPGGCGQWQHSGITREAYEAVLLEVEELQTRLIEEQRELAHAKSQVRDLEKALLQETRGSQNSRRALSDKLREIEEREATLVAEISELREQNELLEFRVLELEETPCLRDTPDPADSGIVSPEPIHLYKDQLVKQKDRAVATVIPYNTYSNSISPIPQKPPLSLQESGIFEEDDEADVELASRGTQTDTPAGDLLQEVQRLHELRARIQERAVKVPVPVIDAKVCSVPDVTEVTDSAQTTVASYQDRIRELEQRLAEHEEAEVKRLQEKQLSKQREEDLLDENYRLTEKIYWFENIFRNSKNVNGASENLEESETSSQMEENPETSEDLRSETPRVHKIQTAPIEAQNPEESCLILSSSALTDAKKPMELTLKEFDAGCRECGKMRTEVVGRLEELVEVELLTRQRIVDLERREAMYLKTLQKADETWAQTERNYSTQLEELRAKLELELSTNETLARRAEELEEKLKELQNLKVSVDDVDSSSWNLQCQITKNQETFAAMEVDHEDDAELGKFPVNPLNPTIIITKSNSNSKLIEKVTEIDCRNFTMEQDTMRKIKKSKVHVPELAAELATEAKEENVPESAPENGRGKTDGTVLGVRRDEEVGEEVDGVLLEKDETGVDVVGVRGAEAEPVVTINETEPEKKDKSAGAAWYVQVTYRNGTSIAS